MGKKRKKNRGAKRARDGREGVAGGLPAFNYGQSVEI
jgi:hypothetical protein